MAGVRDPIPVRVLETGEHYPSIKAAIAAVTGRKPHGRDYANYAAGWPINGLHILPEKAAYQNWVDPGGPPGRCRPVHCPDTGVTFASLSEAAGDIGVAPSSLHRAIRERRHCGGYLWRYA